MLRIAYLYRKNGVCIIKWLKTKQKNVEAQITKVYVLTLTFFSEDLIFSVYPLSKKRG
jgi:hypothetical protein